MENGMEFTQEDIDQLVTVRRYMNYLIENNEASSRVDYSTGGRPRVEYSNHGYED